MEKVLNNDQSERERRERERVRIEFYSLSLCPYLFSNHYQH